LVSDEESSSSGTEEDPDNVSGRENDGPEWDNSTSESQSNSSPDESSNSDSEGISEQNSSDNDSTGSATDGERAATSESGSDLSKNVIIYFRAQPGLSTGKATKIKEILRADYPHAVVLLEAATKNSRSPYPSRAVFNRLLTRVFDKTVSKILVADSNHICGTKDGFQLFCWVCEYFDAKVLVSPALQIV
jgi:hypothetical protein